jgi:hypothetical protein
MLRLLLNIFTAWMRSKPVGGRCKSREDSLATVPASHEVILGQPIPSRLEMLRRGGKEAVSAPIVLTLEERKKHVYLLGSTGTGKTNLLLQLFETDVRAGHGAVLLDLVGDLKDRATLRLAALGLPDLADRLVDVELRGHAPYALENEPVVALNPLTETGPDPYTNALYVLDVLRQRFDIGVQTEEVLRSTLLALAMTGGTLLDVEPLLTIPAYRQKVLSGVTDAGVLRFFARYDALPGASRQQWVAPCLNKLNPFLSRPSLRLLLGQKKGKLSFRRLFDERPDAVVLCCLGADELFGSAGLVGSLIISAVTSALMRADRTPSSRTTPVFLYLDEFQNLADNDRLQAVISEGRRYGLGLLLAHQSTVQLEPKVRSIIRNVVGTQIFFAVGGLDGDQLAGEIPSDEPKGTVRNLLISQQIGEALVTRRGKPFSRLRTAHVPDPQVPLAKVLDLRRVSLARWGRLRTEVEEELAEREHAYTELPYHEDTAAPPAGTALAAAVLEVREMPTDGGVAPEPPPPMRARKGKKP